MSIYNTALNAIIELLKQIGPINSISAVDQLINAIKERGHLTNEENIFICRHILKTPILVYFQNQRMALPFPNKCTIYPVQRTFDLEKKWERNKYTPCDFKAVSKQLSLGFDIKHFGKLKECAFCHIYSETGNYIISKKKSYFFCESCMNSLSRIDLNDKNSIDEKRKKRIKKVQSLILNVQKAYLLDNAKHSMDEFKETSPIQTVTPKPGLNEVLYRKRGTRIYEDFYCKRCGTHCNEGWKYKTTNEYIKLCNNCKVAVKYNQIISVKYILKRNS